MRGTRCKTGDAGPTERQHGNSVCAYDTARRDGHQPPQPSLTGLTAPRGQRCRGTRRRRPDDEATTTRRHDATTRRGDDVATTRRGAWGRHNRCSPQLPHSRCRSRSLLNSLAAARSSTRSPHSPLPSHSGQVPLTAAQIPTSLTCLTASWKRMGEDSGTGGRCDDAAMTATATTTVGIPVRIEAGTDDTKRDDQRWW